MKTYLFVFMCVLSIGNVADALPGPEIPVPSPTIEKAIIIVDTFYRMTFIADFVNRKWYEECFIDSVVYKRTGRGTWNWLITFRHPRGNDMSMTFKINRDGTVERMPVSSTQ